MSESTWLPALIDPSLSQGMLAGLIVYVICLIFFFNRRKPLQNFLLLLLFVYIGALASLTMVIPMPSAWHISAKSTQWAIKQIAWVPFESAGNMQVELTDIITIVEGIRYKMAPDEIAKLLIIFNFGERSD